MFVFFFKQKTAYEMRISDWSSDVCSSDLRHACEVPEDVRALCEAVWNIADGARRACGIFVCDLDWVRDQPAIPLRAPSDRAILLRRGSRSEEHTSELQSLMRISYAVFCLKKKTHKKITKRPMIEQKKS